MTQTLVNETNAIATANGWQTKELSKTLNDREFGQHEVAALVMQKDLCQLMLEPHRRTAPGVEGGFAGIYLIPAYDDAASLYFYDERWNIHVRSKRSSVIARVATGDAMPFAEGSLLNVLDGCRNWCHPRSVHCDQFRTAAIPHFVDDGWHQLRIRPKTNYRTA